MNRTSGVKIVETAWSSGLLVRAEGAGTVAHAGAVLPRLLADRVGLTGAFGDVLARCGLVPGRDRGRAVTDTVAALAAGASCLSDVEAMTAQVELFGPAGGASDTTVLRVLGEYADRLREDGLPGRRLAGRGCRNHENYRCRIIGYAPRPIAALTPSTTPKVEEPPLTAKNVAASVNMHENTKKNQSWFIHRFPDGGRHGCGCAAGTCTQRKRQRDPGVCGSKRDARHEVY